MKIDVEYLEFMWPLKTYLITSGNIDNRANIASVGFCMPAAGQPPQVVFSIGKKFCTYELVKENGEFIINIPGENLVEEIKYCGFNSGYSVDKFSETGLTPVSARKVRAPIIEECHVHMECRVVRETEVKPYYGNDLNEAIANKVLFIGEVVEAYADKEIYDAGKSFYAVDSLDSFPRAVYGVRFGLSD